MKDFENSNIGLEDDETSIETPVNTEITPEEMTEEPALTEGDLPSPEIADESLVTELEEETESAEVEIETGEKEETRARQFLRRFIRWTAGPLIIFGLGFIIAIFLLYNPTKNSLNQSLVDKRAAEQTAADLQSQVTTLASEIASLTTERDNLVSAKQNLESNLDAANSDLSAQQEVHKQELQAQQDAFDLQLTILTARVEVSKAQVALYDENTGLERIILANIGESLLEIESLLPTEYKDAIQPLQDRLQIFLDEIGSEPGNAIEDLDILAGDLLELEDVLFE